MGSTFPLSSRDWIDKLLPAVSYLIQDTAIDFVNFVSIMSLQLLRSIPIVLFTDYILTAIDQHLDIKLITLYFWLRLVWE